MLEARIGSLETTFANASDLLFYWMVMGIKLGRQTSTFFDKEQLYETLKNDQVMIEGWPEYILKAVHEAETQSTSQISSGEIQHQNGVKKTKSKKLVQQMPRTGTKT